MRVLMVPPCFEPVKGGTETVVRNLTFLLNKANIRTDVLTFNMDQRRVPSWQGEIINNNGFCTYKIPALNLVGILRSHRLSMGVNFIPSRFTNILSKYDIIHFHEADFSFPLFSSLVKKPKILHLHGFDTPFLKRNWISRMLLKHLSDYYICISRKMTKELLSLGISRDRIFYLPNGVDVNLFKPHEPKTDRFLLYVGRVSPIKGVHVLIKALRYLKEPVPLVIIGPMDNNYRPEIMGLIEDENRRGKHKITYLGQMDNFETVKWYQKASMFILPPPNYEALGIVNLEALACETPVVATKVGGIPEVVRHGENGLLVAPNNAAELADAIQYLLDNDALRQRFGKEGRRFVLENFSNDVVVEKLLKIYKELVT